VYRCRSGGVLQWRQAAAIVQEYRETFRRSGNCFAPTPEGTH